MNYALRKSHGGLSAGTRVFLNEQPGKTRNDYYCVTLDHIHEVVVPASDLVELRSRTDLVPAVARINRPDRVARRVIYNLKKDNDDRLA